MSSAGIEKRSNSPSFVKSHPEDRTVKNFLGQRLTGLLQSRNEDLALQTLRDSVINTKDSEVLPLKKLKS